MLRSGMKDSPSIGPEGDKPSYGRRCSASEAAFSVSLRDLELFLKLIGSGYPNSTGEWDEKKGSRTGCCTLGVVTVTPEGPSVRCAEKSK